MLDIRLLGTPLVFLDGELIQINRRATRVLLFYLAANEEPISRMKLCHILWGHEGSESELRKRLRTTLSNLRKALPERDIFDAYHDTLRLNGNIYVDLREFTALMKRIRPYTETWCEGQSFPVDLYRASVKAANLWRGPRLIDNGDMIGAASVWHQFRNEELKKDRVVLYTFLSRLEEHFGREKKAIFWSQRALEDDKYHEEAVFLLLRGLLRLGRRSEALRYYRSIEKDVPDYYGKFAEDIRRLGRTLTQKQFSDPPRTHPEWDMRPSLQVPFVGQERALQNVRRGYVNGKAVLIVGEAGAGKTRLVQEIYQNLKKSHRLLSLPCMPSGENLPYQPWIDMLRREIENTFWESFSDDARLKPLSMFLLERNRMQNLPSYAQSIVFDAIKHLLLLLAEKNPIILFVDNAQWADEATLASLTYLIEQSFFKDQQISLIITSRVEESSAGMKKIFLSSLQNRTEKVEINRLNKEDIANLAFFIFEEDLPDNVLSRLLRITGGNPFFVLEMLSAYGDRLTSGLLDFQIPVPDSVRELISIRLEKLRPSAKKILFLAAVQGDPFTVDVLKKVSDLSLEALAEILTELERAQLISLVDKERNEYTFVHEIIRETLIDSQPPLQRQLLHKKIAQALNELKGEYTNEYAAVLAEHYENAREYSLAFSQWIQAGKYAYRLFSVDDASATYRRAEAIISKTALPNEAIYKLYVSWGIMLFENDNPDALEEVMQRFLKLGEERGSNQLIGAALDGMSDVYMARNQFEKGLEYTEDALRYLNADKNISAQMSALTHQGVFLYMRTRFADAQESIQKALDLGEGKDDPLTLYVYGHALYQMATIFTGMGRLREALAYAKQSLQAMRHSRSPHGVILPYSIMGLANYYLVDIESGLQYAVKAIELAERAESWRMLGYACVYAGLNYTGTPQVYKAWEYAQKAIWIGEKYNHTEITSLGYKIIGDIYIHLDAFQQAEKTYLEGMRIDKEGFAGLENAARHGVTLGLLGAPDAQSELQETIAKTRAVGLNILALSAETLALGIDVLDGNYAAFEKKAPLVAAELKDVTHPDSLLWIDYLRAFSYFRRGQAAHAAVLFEKIFTKYAETPFFWIYFRALRSYIVILKQLGRDASKPRAELAEIVRKIDQGIGKSPYHEEWEELQKEIRSL